MAVAAVFVAAVVASAGAVGVAAGVAVASIGATVTMVSAAITVGTVGTYVVAAGIGACALNVPNVSQIARETYGNTTLLYFYGADGAVIGFAIKDTANTSGVFE